MFNFLIRKKTEINPEGSFPINVAKKDIFHQITDYLMDKNMVQKLMELGLPMGAKIKVLQHQPGGGVVVAKDNLRIALGPAVAAQIHVTTIEAL